MNNEMTADNMSNEEVIDTLKGIVFNGFDRTTPKERQALDLAIKALEERPQGDLISRSDVKNYARKVMYEKNATNFSLLKMFDEIIDNAPTIDLDERDNDTFETGYIKGLCENRQQGEWIPVSERLPDDRDWYLGVFKEPDTDFIGIPYICDYVGEVTKGTTNEGWILRHCTDVDNASDYFRSLICVAWQPLPEPYKEGGAE